MKFSALTSAILLLLLLTNCSNEENRTQRESVKKEATPAPQAEPLQKSAMDLTISQFTDTLEAWERGTQIENIILAKFYTSGDNCFLELTTNYIRDSNHIYFVELPTEHGLFVYGDSTCVSIFFPVSENESPIPMKYRLDTGVDNMIYHPYQNKYRVINPDSILLIGEDTMG